MNRTGGILWVPFWLLCSCAANQAPPAKVLVETQKSELQTRPPRKPSSLHVRIKQDEKQAIVIIREALLNKDNPELSAWAAIYAGRLGVVESNEEWVPALIAGTQSNERFVQALSWRWLATLEREDLPSIPSINSSDPVVKIVGSLAHLRWGNSPEDIPQMLATATTKPKKGTTSKKETRIHQLRALSEPFDPLVLPLAIAFVEAKRAGWPGKSTLSAAAEILQKLFTTLNLKNPASGEHPASKTPKNNAEGSPLSGQIENSLLALPKSTLRNMALSADTSLKIEALRAIAIKATKPEAGDLGAAAAALVSDISVIQLEGARTFLLLSERARTVPGKK